MSDSLEIKTNKMNLPATIIVAAVILGGSYVLVEYNKQSSIERQQQVELEQKKQEQLAKEEAVSQSEQKLNECIANAEESYSNMWYRECRDLGKLTQKCIDINELDFYDYIKKYEITVDEYIKDRNIESSGSSDISRGVSAMIDYIKRRNDECSCRLLMSTADRFDEILNNNKAKCLELYK